LPLLPLSPESEPELLPGEKPLKVSRKSCGMRAMAGVPGTLSRKEAAALMSRQCRR
jgi:hypothetical protein